MSTWLNLVFFRVPSCLERTINPENAGLWWQSFPKKDRREHSTRWVQKCLVCCCINDVIWQGDMYTVANKVILSVYCVVSC
jgi:hypothetical protein